MSLINDALKRAKQTHRQQAVASDTVMVAEAMPPLQPVEDMPAREVTSPRGTRLLLLVPLLLVFVGLSAWFLWQWSTAGGKTSSPTLAVLSTSTAPTEGGKKNPLQVAAATVAQVTARAQNETPPASQTLSSRSTVEAPKRPETSVSAEPVPAVPSANVILPASAPTTQTAATLRMPASPIATIENSTVQTNVNLSAAIAPAPQLTNVAASTETMPAPIATAARTPAPVRPPVLAPPNFKLQGIFYRVKNPTVLINDRILSVGESIEGYRIVEIERQSVKLSVQGYTNVVTLY